MNRIVCKNTAEWLVKRQEIGIGASQAACILGLNPYKSNTELWQELTGRKKPDDLSDNSAVKYGKEAETHIRALFALEHSEMAVDYHEFDILQSSEYPFMFATLDGELTDKQGRKGVLEIKTAEPRNKVMWEEWNNQIPQHYYCQILHQLVVTGWEFAILRARLKLQTESGIKIFEREYRFEVSECVDDMKMLITEETKFIQNVRAGKKPPQLLPEI